MSEPKDWLRPELRNMRQYRVADARGLIKLDAMENPYPLPEALRASWARRLGEVQVNRYPDADAEALKRGLRRAMGVPESAALMLGNGSDEILQILMLALTSPGASLVTPEPGFAMFRLIALAVGLRYVGVPLGEDFQLDTEAMIAAIEREHPALVLVAQPNNPTGNAFHPDALRAVVEAAPGIAAIDEAYFPFSDAHCLQWLDEYENLLIVRTLSKLGLAGLRLGLLAGPPRWLRALEPLRLPYNVNALTQAAAGLAVERYDAFLEQAGAIRAERAPLAGALEALPGVSVYPSRANFLLLRVPSGKAGQWHSALLARRILVKNLDGVHPRLDDCLRVTVGTPAENDAVIEALGAIAGPESDA